jgi:predicted enzyme related to lactoylglutathione lyase
MTTHGAFHWNELMTRDVKKAKDFYGKTLGWTYDDMPMGDMYGTYSVAKAGGQMVGGIFEMKGPMFEGMPENWFSYIAVDDLDKRLKLLKDSGGKVMRDPFDVDGVGRMAIVEVPGGAAQGWIVPAPGGM